MNEERIKELFSDEEYVKSLFELGSYEAASVKLAEDGVDVSPEELKKVVNLTMKMADGELSDEELENVAGGIGVLAGTLLAIGLLGGAALFAWLNVQLLRNC